MTNDALADELLSLRYSDYVDIPTADCPLLEEAAARLRKPVRNLDRFGNVAEAVDAYAEVIGKKPIEFGKGRVLSRFTADDLCEMLNWLYMPVKETNND